MIHKKQKSFSGKLRQAISNRIMLNGRITYFFIIQAILMESKGDSQWKSFTSKLVNHSRLSNDQRLERNSRYERIGLVVPEIEFRCKYKCANGNATQRDGRSLMRFIDQGTGGSVDGNEMEAPAAKFSFFNLLTGDGDGGDEDDDLDAESYDYGEKAKEDEEDDDINFFGDEEENEIALNKLKDKDKEGSLKQYHRKNRRMHNIIFPLLVAYKLKFFTVLPLLLGSLILLVGTTGIAGFFFALFAAALGLHVKTENN